MSAAEVIAARIHREGSIPFDAFMECALYEPDQGFFARGHGAGRAGDDFVTSPEGRSKYELRPSLLASRIKVSRFDGLFRKSDE